MNLDPSVSFEGEEHVSFSEPCSTLGETRAWWSLHPKTKALDLDLKGNPFDWSWSPLCFKASACAWFSWALYRSKELDVHALVVQGDLIYGGQESPSIAMQRALPH